MHLFFTYSLLKELYPTIVYAPNSGKSVEFRELSRMYLLCLYWLCTLFIDECTCSHGDMAIVK